MTDLVLSQFDSLLDDAFDRKLTELLASEADSVGPKARHQLKGILKHYAKEKEPFRACVRDNTKRFGKDGAERVCATLKDIIRGTTRWRGKNNPKDHGAPGVAGLSEPDVPTIDEDVAALIDKLGEMDLYELLGLAELDNESEAG
jgi:hypothetical protein